MLRAFLIVLALLLASPAWAQVCTLGITGGAATGSETIGPIGTYSDDCDETGAPVATDLVIIPNGLTLTVNTPGLAMTGSGGIWCKSGGSLIVNTVDEAGLVRLTFENGSDDSHATIDNVAIYQEAGCTFSLNGALVEYGTASPGLVAEHTYSNDTTWPVQWLWPCSDAADVNMTWPFGIIDCAADHDNELVRLYYNEDSGNPYYGGTGQTYLANSLVVVNSFSTDGKGFIVCGEPSTAWSGLCYPVEDIDHSHPGDASIVLNILQNTASVDGLVRATDNGDYPVADRELVEFELEEAITPGDICVSVTGGSIAADGDYGGRWLRVLHETAADEYAHGEGLRSFKIAWTDASEGCDGNAVDDAIWLDNPGGKIYNSIPFRIAATESVLIGYPFWSGDAFTVQAPVTIEIVEGTTAGEGLLILEGGNAWSSVQLIGVPSTQMDGASFVGGSVHWFAGGASTTVPVVLLENMGTFTLLNSSLVGGSLAGGAIGISIGAGNTGVFRLDNVRFQYLGNYAIESTGTSTVKLDVSRLGCEMIGRDGDVPAIAGCVRNDAAGYWKLSQVVEAHMIDGANGEAFYASINRPIAVRGLIVWGETEGGITKTAGAAELFVSEMLARGVHSDRANATRAWLPNLDGGDIGGYVCTTCDGPLWYGSNTSILQNVVINAPWTHGDTILTVAADNMIRNVIILNPYTDLEAATTVIEYVSDNTAATVPSILQTSIIFDTATQADVKWIKAIEDSGTLTNETDFNFGGILVHGFQGDDAGDSYFGIDLNTGLIAFLDGTDGQICVSDMMGGAAVPEFVDDIGSYAVTPLIGVHPRFSDPFRGDYSLTMGSVVARAGCGALTGLVAPGFHEAGNDWAMRQVGIGGR